MFHFLPHATLTTIDDTTYLTTNTLGIQVHYNGTQTTGTFFLFPHLDDNNKTIQYYAFDSHEQKARFTRLTKLSGIGHKTALHISAIPAHRLKQIVETLDTKALQQLPGIGPKTAKRLIIERKNDITKADAAKLANTTSPVRKQIITYLTSLGYPKSQITSTLDIYPDPLTPANQNQAIQRLIKQL